MRLHVLTLLRKPEIMCPTVKPLGVLPEATESQCALHRGIIMGTDSPNLSMIFYLRDSDLRLRKLDELTSLYSLAIFSTYCSAGIRFKFK